MEWLDVLEASTLVAVPTPLGSAASVSGLVEAFQQINASWSLEGMLMSSVDLAVQRRLIGGELSFDEAVALCLAPEGLR